MAQTTGQSTDEPEFLREVSDLLAGSVPDQLVSAYISLLGHGTCREFEAEKLVGSADDLKSLVQRGLAHRAPRDPVSDSIIRPTDPSLAFRGVLDNLQDQLTGSSNRLIEAHEKVDVLQRAFARHMLELDSDESVKRVVNASEIHSLSVSMVNGAKSDFMELHTWRFTRPLRKEDAAPPPLPVMERGIRRRSIYSTEYFDTEVGHHFIQNAIRHGTDVRIYRNLHMKLKLIDEDAALVPLTPSGANGVLYIRAPIIVRALRQYYELLWARATPLTSAGKNDGNGACSSAGDGPSDIHRQLLKMMALGLKDESIANRTGLSLRTVRRHIATIMGDLSAETRFAAGVTAAKRGLLD